MKIYNTEGQGIKFDGEKDRFHLLPFDLMAGEQRVWEFGAHKYAPMNWRKGMPMSQPFNALIRHVTMYMAGEDNDPESGESHLDHAVCCLRMMQNTAKYHPQLDDRIKQPHGKIQSETRLTKTTDHPVFGEVEPRRKTEDFTGGAWGSFQVRSEG